MTETERNRDPYIFEDAMSGEGFWKSQAAEESEKVPAQDVCLPYC